MTGSMSCHPLAPVLLPVIPDRVNLRRYEVAIRIRNTAPGQTVVTDPRGERRGMNTIVTDSLTAEISRKVTRMGRRDTITYVGSGWADYFHHVYMGRYLYIRENA